PRFVPAGSCKAATLDEKKVHRAPGRLLKEDIASNPERSRLATGVSDLGASAIRAGFSERGEIDAPEIPAPIVIRAAINTAGAGNLLLRNQPARGRHDLEGQGGPVGWKKVGRNHGACWSGLFVAHLVDKDAHTVPARGK